MTDERKQSQSLKMKALWRKCEKFGKILGKDKVEVFNNIDLINEYSKQLRGGNKHFICRENFFH